MVSKEILRPPSPLELRSELQDLVERDLLGPAGGDDEIIDKPTIRTRYLLGQMRADTLLETVRQEMDKQTK